MKSRIDIWTRPDFYFSIEKKKIWTRRDLFSIENLKIMTRPDTDSGLHDHPLKQALQVFL